MNWKPERSEREVDDEIRFHIEMETEKNVRAGMSAPEARRAAKRAFGGVRRVQEEIRDLRRTRPVEMFLRDVIYGWRSLRRTPAYALTCIATLGVAAGVCAAMLTFLHTALLRPLPFGDVERVVTLWETNTASREQQLEVSPANFLDWQARATVFQSLALLAPHGFDVRRGDRVISVGAGRVSLEYFNTLGVTPVAGRFFEPRDYEPGAEPRVVLARSFFEESFAGDLSRIGTTMEVDGKPTVLLGVVADEIEHGPRCDIYAPLFLHPGEKTSRSGHWMHAVGRLRPGATIAEGTRDLDRVATMLAKEHPATNDSLRVRLIPIREAIVGRTERLLTPLTAGSICLLLLACANVAALALARGTARRRELAVRLSLGATTGRITRQLATESAMLTAAAAIVSWGVASAVIGWMVRNTPAGLRRMDDAAAGWTTAGAILLTAAASAILTGLLPALRLVHSGLTRDLESSRREAGVTAGEARLQSILVVAQIAIALLLLTGAGLLTRSLQRLTSNDLGFDPEGLATIQLYLHDLHPDRAERVAFISESLRAMRAMPGVTAAGATSALPFEPAIGARDEFEIIGRPRRTGESLTIKTTTITPGFFDTMRTRLVAGRDLADTDTANSPRVAVINQAAASRFWSESPIGSKVLFGVMGPPREWTVVGVVADTRDTDYAQPPAPQAFVPVAQGGSHVGGLNYVVRSSLPARRTAVAMQEKMWEMTPSQSIVDAAAMTTIVARSIQTQRFALLVMTGFGAIALLLSCTGVFGLLSYIAERRRPEMGVRMALGATPRHIQRLFVRRGLTLAGAGIAAGIVLSTSFSGLLESLLYETSSFDPAAILTVVATTAFVALLASWIPAKRIASLDPSAVLRSE